MRYRWLVRDYERLSNSRETLVKLAMIGLGGIQLTGLV
jgi:hypothetical protein